MIGFCLGLALGLAFTGVVAIVWARSYATNDSEWREYVVEHFMRKSS